MDKNLASMTGLLVERCYAGFQFSGTSREGRTTWVVGTSKRAAEEFAEWVCAAKLPVLDPADSAPHYNPAPDYNPAYPE